MIIKIFNSKYFIYAIILISLIFYTYAELVGMLSDYFIYVQFTYFISSIFTLFHYKNNWFKVSFILFAFHNLCFFLISFFIFYFIKHGSDLDKNFPYLYIYVLFILAPIFLIYVFSIFLFLIIRKISNLKKV